MKKISTLIIAIVVTMATSSASAQFRLGVTAGMEISTLFDKDDYDNYSSIYSPKIGLKLGLITEFSITNNFAIVPELVFAQRGFTINMSDVVYMMGGYYDGDAKVKTTINYFQLPINAVIGIFQVNDNCKISLFTGPYFAYAISGKIFYTNLTHEERLFFQYNGASLEEKLSFGSDKDMDHLKAFDFGWNFGAGIELHSFFFKAQYNLGLSNLSLDMMNSNAIEKNRNIGLSIGYMFNINKD